MPTSGITFQPRVTVLSSFVAAACLLCFAGPSGGEGNEASLPHLRKLRFSGDGRYVLAQDDAAISVLSVKPLSVLFRIPPPHATKAHFDPSSREIVFVVSCTYTHAQNELIRSSPARVERWSIADRALAGSTEVALPDCGTVGLSPDGWYLGCAAMDGTFRLISVRSGATAERERFFTRKMLYSSVPGMTAAEYDGKLGCARIDFSPDGRFMVALPERFGSYGVFWDFQTHHRVKPKGRFVRFQTRWDIRLFDASVPFAFVAADKAMLSWARSFNKKDTTVTARLVSFPSGKTLLKTTLPPAPLYRAADPSFVIERPCGKWAACAVEYATGEVITSELPAFDVLGKFYVAEPRTGEVGLYERGKGLQSSVSLAPH